ncbi:CPBP family intramembrane glutamic endopeptidase [Thalassotalea marina]|uniref:CAAX prenyl protease 2/Lysostaphin resistance protein A-like domain-containing protein n=1 Tax=Thalassotalea marina TaxID=1673741 RepID=A0A919EH09_9GAMM|nr:CPBP family intramembrane glutamic endopeptidase [Thalassotalea marina]GHF78824.1 hypothetical protein GCM10017161_02400 [Thalassotalea marina]
MKSSGLAVFIILIIGTIAQDTFLAQFFNLFISSTFYSNQLAFCLFSIFMSAFLIKFVIEKREDTKELIKLDGVSYQGALVALVIGVLMVPVSFGLHSIEVLTVAQFSPDFANSLWDFENSKVTFEKNDKLGSSLATFFTFAIVHSVIGPFMEELTFRGAILSIWNTKYSKISALILTSLLFTVIHPVKSYLDIFVFSFFVGWLTLQTRKLIYAYLIHATYNLFSWLLEGYNLLEVFRNKSPLLLSSAKTWTSELTISFLAAIVIAFLVTSLNFHKIQYLKADKY